MGLSQALYSGISGLQTHQQCMDNIGNNLANVNTVGFKKGVFQFRTMLEHTLKGGTTADPNTGRGSINPLQMGLGTQTGSIMKDFTGGSPESTGNQRDMCLEGNGFFVLRNGNNNVFTRDGTFYIGSDGSLLYGEGLQVQGIMAETGGTIPDSGDLADINIPIGKTGAAVETTKISLTGNLNSNVEVSTGLNLAANANTINSNEALKKYLGDVKDAAATTGADDSTWDILSGNAYINGGTVWSSSAFGVKDPITGAITEATLSGDNATPLEDLWYLSGSTWTQPFKNIDNPARFTAVGDSSSQLTQWDFGGAGFKLSDTLYYHLEPNSSTPVGYVMEVYDVAYSDVQANLTSGAWTSEQAYSHLLATTASSIPSTAAPWSLHTNPTDAGLALTTGTFNPAGSDIVNFVTTDAGTSWAQTHDTTMTAATAREAFNGNVRFGNSLDSGDGRLDSYTPSNTDQDITISYRKGGRKYETTFSYSDSDGAQSTNIEHLMMMLCGNVNSTVNAGSIEAIQTQLAVPPIGGAMGTIQTAGRVSSSIDGGEYGYNVPPETAGAFTRTGMTTTVPYAGAFQATGDDSTSLTNWDLDQPGWAIKSKWYYETEAFEVGSSGTYEYSVTAYSDSARNTPVSTTNKALGVGGCKELQRSVWLDSSALGTDVDDIYEYSVAGPDTSGNFAMTVYDMDTGFVVGTTGSHAAGSSNIIYDSAGSNVGTVSFGTLADMQAGSGNLYMNNMYQGTGLSNTGTTGVHLETTTAGITYSQNNGIGAYSALTAFNGSLDFGSYFAATEVNPSFGSLDTNGPSKNYSIVSNLGSENAITDIVIGYNNVSYTDMWTQDSKYSAEQGGSTTTNLVVYDSLGNPKEVTMTMALVERDSDFSTYRWIADSKDDTDAKWFIDEASNEIKTNVNVGTGTIRFDSDGNYVKGAELSETQGIDITLKQMGVSDQLRVNLTEGLSPDAEQNLDFSYMTQVASSSDFNLKDQDGSAPGTLDSFTTSPDGVIQGVYSNGVVKAIARLSIALVPNPNGMMAAGSNLYYTAPASGDGQIAFANVGGRGSIRASAIEASNVDMSKEFTNMITTQRGFQANSKTITTADEMLQELINLKR